MSVIVKLKEGDPNTIITVGLPSLIGASRQLLQESLPSLMCAGLVEGAMEGVL